MSMPGQFQIVAWYGLAILDEDNAKSLAQSQIGARTETRRFTVGQSALGAKIAEAMRLNGAFRIANADPGRLAGAVRNRDTAIAGGQSRPDPRRTRQEGKGRQDAGSDRDTAIPHGFLPEVPIFDQAR